MPWLLLLLTLAPGGAAEDAPARQLGFGFAFEAGRQRTPEGVRIASADLRTIETRYFIDPLLSADLRVDWVRLVVSRLLTSNPELPISACLHWRKPLWRRWSLGLAPGLDTWLGVESLVIDDELAWRPTAMLAYTGKAGLEHASRRARHDWGLFLRYSLGADLALSGSAPVSRFVLEMSFTWNLLKP